MGIVNLGADDIGGKHVGGELEPGEFDVKAIGEGFDREGLGQARDAFEEDVAVGQQANDQAFDQVSLADDDFAQFIEKRAHKRAGLLDRFVDSAKTSIHGAKS